MQASQSSTVVEKAVHHVIEPTKPMINKTITYQWKSSAGTKMYVTVGSDEFGIINSMILNVGSSGTTIHNLCNALGRVISIAIQNDKATALQIVQTLEGVSSEVTWMSDTLGTAKSIPEVLSAILLRHVEVEHQIESMSTGEEEDEL